MSEPRPPGTDPQETPGVFSRTTVTWLIAVGVLSFCAAIGFAIFGGDLGDRGSSRADTFSRSAIGHRGLVQLLKKLDVPVVISQHDSGTRAGESALLVVAEPYVPDFAGARADALREMLGQAEVSLVVLPKWYGIADPDHPGWVGEVEPLAVAEVEPTLALVDPTASLVRPAEAVTEWHLTAAVEDDVHLRLAAAKPTLASPQLIRSEDVIPLIASDAGILLGETWIAGRQVWVLADPDLLSNHGLGKGDNAALAVAIIDLLREDGAVVFDETLHGFQKEPSLWQAMFEFPLVLATLQVLVAIVLLLWAATGRFGAPAPPPPAIEPGKGFLIANTAALLRFGGHAGHALTRYLYTTMQEVARELHAPADLYHRELRTWLERVASARGVGLGLAALEQEVDAVTAQKNAQHRRVVLTANRIYRWRQEMIHGPANRPRRQ